jgi:multisubunit Na+/H+ antiporter MnhB subunit
MVELIAILVALMIIPAVVAVETRHLLSSIVCLGAVGFLVAIAFLLLGAPDIAITQVVVEILSLIILIRATIERDVTAISGEREFFGMVTTVAMVVLLLVFGVRVAADLPAFGKAVMDRFGDTPSGVYVAEGLRQTGAANIVTAIILDYRGYDTLGEATVLFCAILGAVTLLRRKARKPANEADAGGDGA